MLKPILFIIISQLLLVSSVSASSYSYDYSYRYGNTYYGYSNTVSTEPRTITLECTDPNVGGVPGGIRYMMYTTPTCVSLTGEHYGTDSGDFSGYANYRCVRYSYSECVVYRYETTYTPPKQALTLPYNPTIAYITPIQDNSPTNGNNGNNVSAAVYPSYGPNTYIGNTIAPYISNVSYSNGSYSPVSYSSSNYGVSQYRYAQ